MNGGDDEGKVFFVKCKKKKEGGGVEGWWKCGIISEIKALFPTGCKSPIEYGEGALEQY